MKNIIIIASFVCSICLLSACGGDHMDRNGKADTVKSTYPPVVDSSAFDKDTGRNIPGMHGKALKTDTTKK